MRILLFLILIGAFAGCSQEVVLQEQSARMDDLEERIVRLEKKFARVENRAADASRNKDPDVVEVMENLGTLLRKQLGVAFEDPVEKFSEVYNPPGGLGKNDEARVFTLKSPVGSLNQACGGFIAGKLWAVELYAEFDELKSQMSCDTQFYETKELIEKTLGIRFKPMAGQHRSLSHDWHNAGTYSAVVGPYFFLYTGRGYKFHSLSISNSDLLRRFEKRK